MGNFANTKWCKKPEKWLKPWHMGTHMKVLRVSCPMNTSMTWFRWFSKMMQKTWTPVEWLKPWHMGTHMKVLSVSYPMNTNMTWFRWFSIIFASLYFGWKYPQHWKGYVTIWKISAWKWMDEIILSDSILSCCWIVQKWCISSITVSRFHGVFKWNTKNPLQPCIRKCDSQGKRNYFLILTCDARTFFLQKNDVDGDIRLKDMKSIPAQRALKKIYFRDNYPVNHHLEYIWRDIQFISCMDNFPLIIFDFALSRNYYYIFISWENTSIIQLNSYNIIFRSDIFKFCFTPKLLLYFHLQNSRENIWRKVMLNLYNNYLSY